MFRNQKRKPRPISAPMTPTVFASDSTDDCKNGIDAFAAEFDVSVDETDVYGNLEFKSFLEDVAIVKNGHTMPSGHDTWANRDSDNYYSADDLVLSKNSGKQDVEDCSGEYFHAQHHLKPPIPNYVNDVDLDGRVSVKNTGKDSMEVKSGDVCLRRTAEYVVGSSGQKQKHKGRAPLPPKRLSSLHLVNEDVSPDSGCYITDGDSCMQLESHDISSDSAGGARDHGDGCGAELMATHQALVAELTKLQRARNQPLDAVRQTHNKNRHLEQSESCVIGAAFGDVDMQERYVTVGKRQDAADPRSQVSGTVSLENYIGKIMHNDNVPTAAITDHVHGRQDVSKSSNLVANRKITFDKPRIPVKPVYLKSALFAGLPRTEEGGASKIATIEKVKLSSSECNRYYGDDTDNMPHSLHVDDQKMRRGSCRTAVKINTRNSAEIGITKCDSDYSNEGSTRDVLPGSVDLVMASTPIPPPRRKKLKNRDVSSVDHMDNISTSSSVSSDHSNGRGGYVSDISHEAMSVTCDQWGSSLCKDANTVLHAQCLPSPIRMAPQLGEPHRVLGDCLTFESVPPPPQFDNPGSVVDRDECLDLQPPRHSRGDNNQHVNRGRIATASKDSHLYLRSDKDTNTSELDLTSSVEPLPGLITREASLRDGLSSRSRLSSRSATSALDTSNAPMSSDYLDNTLFAKKALPREANSINMLVEDDYLPQSTSTEEVLPPQSWGVSMSMSAHLMDLACHPWDDTMAPPVSKSCTTTRTPVTDSVWQTKPVELWNTSDICDWCRSSLDFAALADAFQGKKLSRWSVCVHTYMHACMCARTHT